MKMGGMVPTKQEAESSKKVSIHKKDIVIAVLLVASFCIYYLSCFFLVSCGSDFGFILLSPLSIMIWFITGVIVFFRFLFLISRWSLRQKQLYVFLLVLFALGFVVNGMRMTNPTYTGLRYKTYLIGGEECVVSAYKEIMNLTIDEVTDDEIEDISNYSVRLKTDLLVDYFGGVYYGLIVKRDDLQLIDICYGGGGLMSRWGIVVGDKELISQSGYDNLYKVGEVYYYLRD